MTETYGASTGDGVRCGGGGGGGGLGDFSRVVGLGGSCIENGCRDSIISDGPLVGIDGGGAMVAARSKEVQDLMVKVAARVWALEVDS